MDRVMNLNLGERSALMLLLNTFDGDRTSSIMRKTRRVKRAIHHEEIGDVPYSLLRQETAEVEAVLESETLNWLWDTFSKYSKWPTQLDEWVESLEDKIRAAMAAV